VKRLIGFIALILLAIGVPLVAGLFISFALPPPGGEQQNTIIIIPNGATMREVAQSLYERDLIRHRTIFWIYARISGADTKIKSGEYQFARGMISYDILNKLIRGEQIKYSITIPEGYTLVQIAELYDTMKLADRERFITLATDPEFITSLGIKEGTLEGRLYPDTYKFVRNVKEEEIIRRMVKRFNGVFTEAMRQRANELGLSTQEILTLASMIEKETGAVNEKPLISAVFHNRLKRNMRFQCDPTVIYGLDNFTGNITKKELQTFTPYNTYVIEGLPPTPIANPGVESIRAALYPSKVDYLYFVSKNNGTHHFSRTMPEHNRAVDSYQRTKRSNVAPESR